MAVDLLALQAAAPHLADWLGNALIPSIGAESPNASQQTFRSSEIAADNNDWDVRVAQALALAGSGRSEAELDPTVSNAADRIAAAQGMDATAAGWTSQGNQNGATSDTVTSDTACAGSVDDFGRPIPITPADAAQSQGRLGDGTPTTAYGAIGLSGLPGSGQSFTLTIACNGLVAGQSNVRDTLGSHAVLWSGGLSLGRERPARRPRLVTRSASGRSHVARPCAPHCR